MAISEHLTYARCYTQYFISIDSSEQSCEVPLLSHFTYGEIEAQQYLPKVTQSETEEVGIEKRVCFQARTSSTLYTCSPMPSQ